VITFFIVRTASAVTLAMVVALVPAVTAIGAPADPRDSTPIPAGTYVDPSFRQDEHAVVIGGGAMSDTRGNPCPDKAFTAISGVWGTSVPGCNVIGTTPSAKVHYKWYRHAGTRGSTACVQGLGYDSRHRAVWTAAGCGTGQTKTVPWGTVAATKRIKGLGIGGWAGLQWS